LPQRRGTSTATATAAVQKQFRLPNQIVSSAKGFLTHLRLQWVAGTKRVRQLIFHQGHGVIVHGSCNSVGGLKSLQEIGGLV
jgi:uncharacterized protein YgbK (DUF1537 family)